MDALFDFILTNFEYLFSVLTAGAAVAFSVWNTNRQIDKNARLERKNHVERQRIEVYRHFIENIGNEELVFMQNEGLQFLDAMRRARAENREPTDEEWGKIGDYFLGMQSFTLADSAQIANLGSFGTPEVISLAVDANKANTAVRNALMQVSNEVIERSASFPSLKLVDQRIEERNTANANLSTQLRTEMTASD